MNCRTAQTEMGTNDSHEITINVPLRVKAGNVDDAEHARKQALEFVQVHFAQSLNNKYVPTVLEIKKLPENPF